MKLLLDQGLPRSTVEELSKSGMEATHVRELRLATASDEEILAHASKMIGEPENPREMFAVKV